MCHPHLTATDGGNAENAGAIFGRLTRALHGARPSGQLRCSQALQRLQSASSPASGRRENLECRGLGSKVMSEFKDHFSGHAAIYREARPTYPPQLFDWLAQQAPDRELAWDAGCGNGQATAALAQRFTHVIGTDPSANQVAEAEARANIEYRVEAAELPTL